MPSARVRRRSFLPHWALLFLTAVLAGVAGLFGAGSAWAMTVSASAAAVVTAEPETAPHPASTVPSSTYDTVAYDAPAQLSSLNAAAAGARGSSAAPGVTSWQRSVSARGFGVAAETAGSASGLPRYALGQFTSGAGGESAAAAAGRSAHASYPNTLGWSGEDLVQFNRPLPGSSLRPDAVNWTQRVVGELEPGNPSAVAGGWRQVNGYKAYLEELTGKPWTAQVDVYTP